MDPNLGLSLDLLSLRLFSIFIPTVLLEMDPKLDLSLDLLSLSVSSPFLSLQFF